MSAIYLDASAFLTLVLDADASRPLREYLAGAHGRFTSSALLRTEALRAGARHGPEALGAVRDALGRIDLVALDDRILGAAGYLDPDAQRSLDAIHVATALALGDDLDVIVTYDPRMIEAAARMGLPTATPL